MRLKEPSMRLNPVYVFDPELPKGGLTVVAELATNYKNCRVLNVATAVCSNKDTFSRKIGRQLAEQNLEDGVFIQVPIFTASSMSSVQEKVKRLANEMYDTLTW